MGLFSRNESANGSGRRASQRSAGSSEAHVNELRGRARRRLIGALALVVAAVIIVPMLLDTSPAPTEPQTPIVVPAIVPPTPAPDLAAVQPDNANGQNGGAVTESPLPTPDAGGLVDQIDGASPPIEAPAQTAPAPKPAPAVVPKAAENHVEAKAEPESKPKSQRTDDGSVAIALLEGRSPAKAPAEATKGSYVLQIAAYTTDKDAQSRRDRLVSSGVTNAYVETASSGGKSTYRLRVGPFPSREAAQAAQTRLRALGYDNGFISSK
jgi:DedD protein